MYNMTFNKEIIRYIQGIDRVPLVLSSILNFKET